MVHRGQTAQTSLQIEGLPKRTTTRKSFSTVILQNQVTLNINIFSIEQRMCGWIVIWREFEVITVCFVISHRSHNPIEVTFVLRESSWSTRPISASFVHSIRGSLGIGFDHKRELPTQFSRAQAQEYATEMGHRDLKKDPCRGSCATPKFPRDQGKCQGSLVFLSN